MSDGNKEWAKKRLRDEAKKKYARRKLLKMGRSYARMYPNEGLFKDLRRTSAYKEVSNTEL